MIKTIVSLYAVLFLPLSGIAGLVKYELSFPEPHTHYAEVKMIIEDWGTGDLDVKMPVWAPGSYLVREFPKHVESFSCTGANGKSISSRKINKNTWRVTSGNHRSFQISYRVYAFELSVRTSFIDAEHAYLNGTSIFMYCDKLMQEPVSLKIFPFKDWKKISVALEQVEDARAWHFKAANYDELVDAPFEIGNHVSFSFIAMGVPHEVAMFGAGNYNTARIKADFTKIVEECTAVFGEHPCKRYVFIIHNLSSGGGGLEHANSTTLQTHRWSYGSESSYADFLSLVAHEYFHLWNVKRLRPVPLGPFDYSNENYTELLWLAEGFTAYYDDLMLRRCGFISDTDYLQRIAGSMSYCSNVKGAAVQPLSESSLDAWIKFYRPNENSSNTTVSYYTKGSVVAALLDLEIISSTEGKKSLDDVMREMYALYFKKLNRPFTEKEFIAVVNKVTGKPMDDFFIKYVHDTVSLPLFEKISAVGLELKDLNASGKTAWTGAGTNFAGGKLTVTSVERNSPAWTAGLNVNDEIIAIDNYRSGDDLSKMLSMKKPGDEARFTIARNGILMDVLLTLKKSGAVKYVLEKTENPTASQKSHYARWLKL